MAFTNLTKNTSSFTAQAKSTSLWDMPGIKFLLLESGYFLLFENDDNILLEESRSISSSWVSLSKN